LRRLAAANAAVSGERAAEEARAAAAVMEGLDVARVEEAKEQEQAGVAAEAEMEALRIPPGGAGLVFPA
jgi:S-adenosylhomocysteine hydrolase